MTSFHTSNSQSFNADTIAVQATAAAAVAKAQTSVNRTDAELQAAASELVRQEVIATRLNGNDKLWPHWAARQKDYLAYRQKLAFATLRGDDGAGVDTGKLALSVAAAGAGGSLRKDGTVRGTRAGVEVKAAAANGGRWRAYGNGVIDTSSGVIMSKRQASLLGYVEAEGAK